MFLLLAPSALTGKRPGLYCPAGQRSQDAPKSPKEELRGWIARLDKRATRSLLCRTHPENLLNKKERKTAGITLCILSSLLPIST